MYDKQLRETESSSVGGTQPNNTMCLAMTVEAMSGMQVADR